jgi:RNA polymerase sigma-70 factor (ECF subfamily)
MQDAYVRAYQHLNQFEGRAKFSTWLTRIAVNEALARAQRHARHASLDADEDGPVLLERLASSQPDPEQSVSNKETAMFLEHAIMALPESYRTVLVLRDVQELDTAETAECLGLTEENVKIRLHRARAMVQRELYASAGVSRKDAFPFHDSRCDRMVAGVFEHIRNPGSPPGV